MKLYGFNFRKTKAIARYIFQIAVSWDGKYSHICFLSHNSFEILRFSHIAYGIVDFQSSSIYVTYFLGFEQTERTKPPDVFISNHNDYDKTHHLVYSPIISIEISSLTFIYYKWPYLLSQVYKIQNRMHFAIPNTLIYQFIRFLFLIFEASYIDY